MNYIFVIGIVLFLSILGAILSGRLKIPYVVGYITVGIIVGKSFLGIIDENKLVGMTESMSFTLGMIGFLIGSELKIDIFKKYGRKIYLILLSEGIISFLFVTLFVTLLTHKLYLGLILGAVASATDPASTVSVLWGSKSRGPLTTTLTSIVALDDGLALIIYGLVSSFAKSMILRESFSLWHSLASPLMELFSSILLGVIVGVVVSKLLFYFDKKDRGLYWGIIFSSLAFVVGISMYMKLDLILSALIMGSTVSNLNHPFSKEHSKSLKEFAFPLYIFFFILAGASLDIHILLESSIMAVVIIYLLSRSTGKIVGATFGAIMGHAQTTVKKYTGLGLFTQGTVAMGLAVSISHTLSMASKEAQSVSTEIISIVAATTFIVQIIGPFFVKFSVKKAGEEGKNITLDDIINSCKVKDFMSKEFVVIREDYNLNKIMEIVEDTDAYYFPVVDRNNRLVGTISLADLRSIFREYQLDNVILAQDIAVPVRKVLMPDSPLRDAMDIFERQETSYIPVVSDMENYIIVGELEYASLKQEINRHLFVRQRELES